MQRLCPRPGNALSPQAAGDPPAAHSPLRPPRPAASTPTSQLYGRRFPRTRPPATQPPLVGQAPRSPLPALRSGRPGAWLPTRTHCLWVCSGRPGPASAPRSAARRASLANPLRSPRSSAAVGAGAAKGGGRDWTRAEGDRQHLLWKGSGMLLPLGFLVVSPLPRLPCPARAGTGDERGRRRATGTELEMVLPELQGRGSKTVLVSLRKFRGTTGWRRAGGRPVSADVR